MFAGRIFATVGRTAFGQLTSRVTLVVITFPGKGRGVEIVVVGHLQLIDTTSLEGRTIFVVLASTCSTDLRSHTRLE